jgi:hypothetical protein
MLCVSAQLLGRVCPPDSDQVESEGGHPKEAGSVKNLSHFWV